MDIDVVSLLIGAVGLGVVILIAWAAYKYGLQQKSQVKKQT
jgi:hypothetical protein